ncbi:MAG: sucrase ferredoxin [Microthrixaceae bacterium]
MPVESSVVFSNLRCAPFHEALEVDPIGSGGCYDAYLCVEIPLPWERDISGNEPFVGLCKAPAASIVGADGRKWRPQGLVPDAGRGALVQVLAFEQPERARTGRAGSSFERREWLVPPEIVSELCAALLGANDDAIGRLDEFEVTGNGTDRAGSGEHGGGAGREHRTSELFVCTHGQRDVCCGGSGTSLYMDLTRLTGDGGGDGDGGGEDGDGQSGEMPSVRRVSHTGGHRFAPTALSFPDGYAWSHLDRRMALAVATRTVEPAEVLGHIRGSTLFKGGPSQAADRHGLGEVGWAWADAHRSVELIGFDRRTMATDVLVQGELADGTRRAFELRVGIERHVPQITCGVIDSPEYKVEPVWRVEESRAL